MFRQIVARSQSLWMRHYHHSKDGFNSNKKIGAGSLALATTLWITIREDDHHLVVVKSENTTDNTKAKEEERNNNTNTNWVSDIQKDANEWFQTHNIFNKQHPKEKEDTITTTTTTNNNHDIKEEDGWNKMKENMTSWLVRGELSPDDIKSILDKATKVTSQPSDATMGRQSFIEIQSMLLRHFQDISNVWNQHFGSILGDYYLNPTSMYYYLEEQDSQTNNPSYKRRLHRYHPYVQVDELQQFYTSLTLAELSYQDNNIPLIQQTLTNHGYELLSVCSDDNNNPQQDFVTSHFVALPKQQSFWNDTLDVLIVVRGTKSVSDMMTDALIDAIPYRNGLAHAGICKSGIQLAKQHTILFQNLLSSSHKKKLHITFIGHSLGAGVATIAAMELQNNNNDITAHVTGFGCPAILSQELSEQVKPYVTTIIADSDVIPRMSAATIANLVIDIMEYDWLEYGARDIQQALEELLQWKPSTVQRTMTYISQAFHNYVSIKPRTTERMKPQLFPPGQCVHFYRDGFSISGTYLPCTFFQRIDVSRTMIHDHLINDGYRRIFLDIMRDHSGDAHFSFEQPPPTTKK